MRPKLKDNVFYAPTEEGIFLRGASGALELKGARLYEWFERLLPYLQGKVELEQLLQSLSPERRAVVGSLVQKLASRGLLKDASKEEPHGLSEQEQALYADSIRFIDDLKDAGGRRFEAFRRAKVLVVGRGRALHGAARGLMKAGLQRLVVVAEEEEPGRRRVAEEAAAHGRADPGFSLEWRRPGAAWEQELGPYDFAVAVGVEEWLEELSACCQRLGKRLVGTARLEGRGWSGAFVVPGMPGCWSCARARVQAAPEPVQAPWPSMGDMLLGHMAALEVFKVTTGAMEAMAPGKVLQVETNRLQVVPRELPLWPACPACGGKGAELERQLAAWREARPLEPAQAWSAAAPYIEPSTGLLAHVAPEALRQIPLYQCEAVVRLPGRPMVVAPGRSEELARLAALVLGLETYALQVAEQLGDTRGAVEWGGSMLAEREARGQPFASGSTLEEWLGRGLLTSAERRVEQALLSGNSLPLVPLRLGEGYAGAWPHLLHKTAVVRYGVPLEFYRQAEQGPVSVLVLAQGRRVLGVAAERTLLAAVEKGLVALVHTLQQLPASTPPAEWVGSRPIGTWEVAAPVPLVSGSEPPAWQQWAPAAAEWLEARGQRVVVRPFTTDPAVARAGRLCGWVWQEER